MSFLSGRVLDISSHNLGSSLVAAFYTSFQPHIHLQGTEAVSLPSNQKVQFSFLVLELPLFLVGPHSHAPNCALVEQALALLQK